MSLPAKRRSTAARSLDGIWISRHGIPYSSPQPFKPTSRYSINGVWRQLDGCVSIAQPAEIFGRKAVEMLIALIEKTPLSERQVVVPFELTVRGSTAAPHTQ